MPDEPNPESDEARKPPQVAPRASATNPPRLISSDALFAGAREIVIEHNGRRYQLRITALGKLILTA